MPLLSQPDWHAWPGPADVLPPGVFDYTTEGDRRNAPNKGPAEFMSVIPSCGRIAAPPEGVSRESLLIAIHPRSRPRQLRQPWRSWHGPAMAECLYAIMGRNTR